jgi:WD40 repeat protein
MHHPRVAHTATLLDPAVVSGSLAGAVLIAGGDAFSAEGTAELYNPATGTFANTANMATPRRQHTAVLISHCGCAADGSVLIVGGYDNQFKVLNSAELYNPATQTFTPTGSMSAPRFRHTATLLNDGTVLISGGASQMAAQSGNINPSLNSAEIYDPKTGRFSATKGNMTAHREAHAASLLKDGTVLLTGGQDDHFLIENTAEVYDPKSSTFTATSESCAGSPPPAGCMSSGRDFHVSLTLDDGRVLIVGGINSSFATVPTAELYNFANKTFTPTGSLSTPRSGAAANFIATR